MGDAHYEYDDGYQIVESARPSTNDSIPNEQELTIIASVPVDSIPVESLKIVNEIRASLKSDLPAEDSSAHDESKIPKEPISAIDVVARKSVMEEQRVDESLFEPCDGDSMNRAIAKSLLRDLSKGQPTREVLLKQTKNPVIISQEIINPHLRVLEEMMELAPVDLGREAMIIYICKTFSCAGLSDVAGKKYTELSYADQVILVLSIARAYVIPRWIELTDEISNMKHAMMEEYAQFYVSLIWHSSRSIQECCLCQ